MIKLTEEEARELLCNTSFNNDNDTTFLRWQSKGYIKNSSLKDAQDYFETNKGSSIYSYFFKLHYLWQKAYDDLNQKFEKEVESNKKIINFFVR